jgi:hypothetical protein
MADEQSDPIAQGSAKKQEQPPGQLGRIGTDLLGEPRVQDAGPGPPLSRIYPGDLWPTLRFD